jgi:uncharacterized protein
MTFSLYDVASPVLLRGLTNLSGFLDKASAEGFDEAALVQARLHDDMRPLSSQVQLASDSAKGAVARLAGVDNPAMADVETTFAELKDRIARTLAFIESVEPAAFVGAETRPVTLKTPSREMNFDGLGYLTSFVLPNFHFHVTTAYAILRKEGVPLGKMDYLGRLALV